MFIDIIKHLLPRARAWNITINKQLRQFFAGLSLGVGANIKLFLDQIWEDSQPQTTRQLDLWENQFNLPQSILTEQERRDRLDAVWKAKGGQSARYIEDTLQAAGFDVYVHEWWVPGSEPALNVIAGATARDPNDYLIDVNNLVSLISVDGALDMQDGDSLAQDGSSTQPTGYVLVNKFLVLDPNFLGDGALDMQDGDSLAQDGGVAAGGDLYNLKQYVISSDPLTFPYFIYIGGATFPDHSAVASSRRNEFETLCLKICPAQQWLGMLINYS